MGKDVHCRARRTRLNHHRCTHQAEVRSVLPSILTRTIPTMIPASDTPATNSGDVPVTHHTISRYIGNCSQTIPRSLTGQADRPVLRRS